MSACKLVFLNYLYKIISFVYVLITYAKDMTNHYQKFKEYQQNILSVYNKDFFGIKKANGISNIIQLSKKYFWVFYSVQDSITVYFLIEYFVDKLIHIM